MYPSSFVCFFLGVFGNQQNVVIVSGVLLYRYSFCLLVQRLVAAVEH